MNSKKLIFIASAIIASAIAGYNTHPRSLIDSGPTLKPTIEAEKLKETNLQQQEIRNEIHAVLAESASVASYDELGPLLLRLRLCFRQLSSTESEVYINANTSPTQRHLLLASVSYEHAVLALKFWPSQPAATKQQMAMGICQSCPSAIPGLMLEKDWDKTWTELVMPGVFLSGDLRTLKLICDNSSKSGKPSAVPGSVLRQIASVAPAKITSLLAKIEASGLFAPRDMWASLTDEFVEIREPAQIAQNIKGLTKEELANIEALFKTTDFMDSNAAGHFRESVALAGYSSDFFNSSDTDVNSECSLEELIRDDATGDHNVQKLKSLSGDQLEKLVNLLEEKAVGFFSSGLISILSNENQAHIAEAMLRSNLPLPSDINESVALTARLKTNGYNHTLETAHPVDELIPELRTTTEVQPSQVLRLGLDPSQKFINRDGWNAKILNSWLTEDPVSAVAFCEGLPPSNLTSPLFSLLAEHYSKLGDLPNADVWHNKSTQK